MKKKGDLKRLRLWVDWVGLGFLIRKSAPRDLKMRGFFGVDKNLPGAGMVYILADEASMKAMLYLGVLVFCTW
jgi:hypothetical protein